MSHDKDAAHDHPLVQSAAHTAHGAESMATQTGIPLPGPALMAVDGMNMLSGASQMIKPQGDTAQQKQTSRGGGVLDFLQGLVPFGVEMLTHDPMAAQATSEVLTQGRMAADMMMGGGLNQKAGGVLSSIGNFFGFGGGDEQAAAPAAAAQAASPAAPVAAPPVAAPVPVAPPTPAPRAFPNSPLASDDDVRERLNR